MSDTEEDEAGALDQILILAPYRRDAEYLGRLLTENEISVAHCTATDLAAHLAAGPGVLVTTHEALTPALIAMIGEHLRAQPPWSEMPIIVLLDRASANARIRAALETAWPRSRQLF